MFKKTKNSLFVFFFLLLAACAPAVTPTAMMATSPTPDAMMAASPTPDAMMAASPTPDAMMATSPTPDAMMATSPTPDAMMAGTASAPVPVTGVMMEPPAWFGTAFTDVASGMPFSIKDFNGKVVLVEMLSVNCPACLSQQQQLPALVGSLGHRTDFVTVGFDIDQNETLTDLKGFVTTNGFNGYYAVAGPAVATEIGKLYGSQFLDPSSTPMLIIDRQGEVHPLPFGMKAAKDLQDYLTPFLAG